MRTCGCVYTGVCTCTTPINVHGVRPGRYMRDYYLHICITGRVCACACMRSCVLRACMHACVCACVCVRACVQTCVPYASQSATTHRQSSPVRLACNGSCRIVRRLVSNLLESRLTSGGRIYHNCVRSAGLRRCHDADKEQWGRAGATYGGVQARDACLDAGHALPAAATVIIWR